MILLVDFKFKEIGSITKTFFVRHSEMNLLLIFFIIFLHRPHHNLREIASFA